MAKKRITIPVFIPHSGCPHCCVFCNQWNVTGTHRLPTEEEIHKTIKLYLSSVSESVEKVEIAFFGGSFTALDVRVQEEFLSIPSKYIEEGLIHSVRLSTRPDCIDSGILDILGRYSVETVELGVQSFSDRVLAASERGHDSSCVGNAVELLKSGGFRTGIQLMPGLPEDSFETSLKSARAAAELKPDDIRIYPAVVLRDTALAKMYYSKKFVPLTVEEAVEISSRMYGIFIDHGINVIRMGLHPMDIGDGRVIAGPYHEALGFMIKSRHKRNILERIVESAVARGSRKITLLLPEKLQEEYIGMRRDNITYLISRFSLEKLDYSSGDVDYPKILF